MVKVGGKPVLQHQIELTKRYGIKEVFILSGHLGHVISSYFSDGKSFGLKIKHFVEPYSLGTAGCLRQLRDYLGKDERFMVFSGDVVIRMDLARLIAYDVLTPSLGTIVVKKSSHPHDSDLVLINERNRIIPFSISKRKKNEIYKKLSVASLGIFSSEIIDYIPSDRPSDLWKEILPGMIRGNETLMAYESGEYVRDMGTSKRLRKVRRDYKRKYFYV